MSDVPHDEQLDPRFIAGVDMLRRTGVKEMRVAFSDEEQGTPIVWWAAGKWRDGAVECAAGFSPWSAILRLCEKVIDGGECAHCQRPTFFEPDLPLETALMDFVDKAFCVYAWDPELSTFRRGCEGELARAPEPKLWVPGA